MEHIRKKFRIEYVEVLAGEGNTHTICGVSNFHCFHIVCFFYRIEDFFKLSKMYDILRRQNNMSNN